MSKEAVTATEPAAPEWPNSDMTLDNLAAMDIDELTELYLNGRMPERAIVALEGSPPCRMLTLIGPVGRGFSATTMARFAASSQFPWAGKSFTATDEEAGSGLNRLRIAGLKRQVFPFLTHIGPSAIDGLPCIILDYEQPENPWFIRQIHDELREVAPNLFLGPAMWKSKPGPKLLLYFAADMS